MIEDQELRTLFQAETEEHLQTLDHGLLRLESNPADSATLEEVFRSAHSLKGAARMLGVGDVEVIAHRLEDDLGAARRGQATLSPEVVDRLYGALDAIRKLVNEAVTGEVAGVDVNRVLAQLRGEAPADRPDGAHCPAGGPIQGIGGEVTGVGEEPVAVAGTPEPEASTPEVAELPVEEESLSALHPLDPPEPDGDGGGAGVSVASALPAGMGNGAAGIAVAPPTPPAPVVELPLEVIPRPHASATAAPVETIRVEAPELDALMTLAGELNVITTRVARSIAGLDAAVALSEEWSRDLAGHRASLNGGAGLAARGFLEREQGRLERLTSLVEDLKQTAGQDVARLGFVAGELDEAICKVRLLPFSTIFNLFPRLVRDLAREQAKEVQLLFEGGETSADKRILEELKDPLMHMLRNAVDHGIEAPDERERAGKPRQATLRLRAHRTAAKVVIELNDDGRGLDTEAIRSTALKRGVVREEELASMTPTQVQRLIFAPGFSTRSTVSDLSGRGVGLDVVRTNIERLKGSLDVTSSPGQGCAFRLQCPITLATTRVLLVQVDGQPYALPVEFVEGTRLVRESELFGIEARETIRLEDKPVSVARLGDLLELGALPGVGDRSDRTDRTDRSDPQLPVAAARPCVILAIDEDRLGLFVDQLLDEQEIVLKPLGPLLRRVRNVAGATILGTGEVCMVLNPHDLLRSLQTRRPPAARAATGRQNGSEARKKTILLAEDSLTTRTQEKRILESAGYEVATAVDGVDAFNQLAAGDFDALVTDVQMPNMDGFTLTARVRQDARYRELPVILVTSLSSDEHRRQGIEAGANAYVTKNSFDQKALLDTLRRLV